MTPTIMSWSRIVLIVIAGTLHVQGNAQNGEDPLATHLGQRFDMLDRSTTRSVADSNIQSVSRWMGGACYDVEYNGDHVFVADGHKLDVLTIVGQDSITAVAELPLNGLIFEIAKSGTYLYSVWPFTIIDIADPSSPQVTFVDSTFSAYKIMANDTCVFLASFPGTIDIVSVSNNQQPAWLSRVFTSGEGIEGMAVYGGNLYVTTADGAYLEIFDITDLSNPQLDTQLATPAGVPITIDNGYLYTTHLEIYNLADPDSPALTGAIPIPGYLASSISVADTFAYIAMGNDGLYVVNIKDLANPEIQFHVPWFGLQGDEFRIGPYRTTVDGNRVYCAVQTGLWTMMQEQDSLRAETFHPTGYTSLATQFNADYAYVCEGFGGLLVLDVSDPAKPAKVMIESTLNPTIGIGSLENHLFVQTGAHSEEDLIIYDITNPADPIKLSQLTFHDTITGLVSARASMIIRDSIVLLSFGANVVHVIDVSDKLAPIVLTEITTNRPVVGLGQWSNIFLTVEYFDQIGVYDISDVNQPVKVDSIVQVSGLGILTQGDNVFIADGDSGLVAYNINGGHPLKLGSLNPPVSRSFVDLASSGQYVYWASSGALVTFDAGNASNLSIIDITSFPLTAGMATRGDLLIVGNASNGLTILRNGLLTTIAQEEPWRDNRLTISDGFPNPSNTGAAIHYSIPRTTTVRIAIYNILGQWITTLIEESRGVGEYSVSWDGRDNSGIVVPAGTYLCIVTANGISLVKKLLLMR